MKKNKEKNEIVPEIDVEQILLYSRNLFLYGTIDNYTSKKICEDLIALAKINNDPIVIWINSYGGCLESSFAIIDIILGLTCPVYTFICGVAASAGALIALAGTKRVMTEQSCWAIHDMIIGEGLGGEYGSKVDARVKQYQIPRWKSIIKYLKSRTFLTNKEIIKAKNEELWLWAEEAKAKGIVNEIAKTLERKQ